jgi:hypothetical protein
MMAMMDMQECFSRSTRAKALLKKLKTYRHMCQLENSFNPDEADAFKQPKQGSEFFD